MKIKAEEILKEFIKVFDSLAQRYSRHQIWSDFIIISACAISNACDHRFWDKREKRWIFI